MNSNLPYTPLMFEHRLIERMVKAVKEQVKFFKLKKEANPVLIDSVVDFLRSYADRCHQGKEEEILFRALEKKKLSEAHKKLLDVLIKEHTLARKLTATMADANYRYIKGDKAAFMIIIQCMEQLVNLYPKHMEKEDKEFFVPVMDYFSDKEKEDMVKAEYEFDRDLLHQIYEILVLQAENYFK